MTRRRFLQGMGGGVLALTFGHGLQGCGTDPGTPQGINSSPDMYVSTFLGNTLERHNPATGARKSSFMTGINPTVLPPGPGTAGIVFNTNGDVWIANRFQDSVFLYKHSDNSILTDAATVPAPYGIAMSPADVLYVPSAYSAYRSFYSGPGGTGGTLPPDTIQTFDGVTGEPRGTFAQVNNPMRLRWGTDGYLYVATAVDNIVANQNGTLTLDTTTHPNSDAILRLDGTTGAVLATVVSGLKLPYDFLFTPDGNLLVSDFLNNRVQLYNPSNGSLLGTFINNVSSPMGLAYGLDGKLYVCSNTNLLARSNIGSVLQFDAATGTPYGTFVADLPGAAYIAFKPLS
jgi:hypothetical protein